MGLDKSTNLPNALFYFKSLSILLTAIRLTKNIYFKHVIWLDFFSNPSMFSSASNFWLIYMSTFIKYNCQQKSPLQPSIGLHTVFFCLLILVEITLLNKNPINDDLSYVSFCFIKLTIWNYLFSKSFWA